jgi:hypothetical protein
VEDDEDDEEEKKEKKVEKQKMKRGEGGRGGGGNREQRTEKTERREPREEHRGETTYPAWATLERRPPPRNASSELVDTTLLVEARRDARDISDCLRLRPGAGWWCPAAAAAAAAAPRLTSVRGALWLIFKKNTTLGHSAVVL